MEFCGKLRPITALFTQCFQLARNRPCLRLAGPSLARHTRSAMPFRKKQNKTKYAKPEHTQWFVCCARITRQSHKLICTTPMSFHGYFYFFPPKFAYFCNPQSKMVQCNTNHCVFSRLFPFHQYSQSGRGNSPLPGCWVAGPARWPGPRAGGPCGRQHDGPCVLPVQMVSPTDRHTLVQGRGHCMEVWKLVRQSE